MKALGIYRVVSICTIIGLLTSCAFGAESSPRPVPDRQRGSLSVAFGSPLSLNGKARVYLPVLEVTSGSNLGSVPRTIDETDVEAFLQALINNLLAGPTVAEQSSGFTSAIPAGTRLLGVTLAVSRVTIDLTSPLSELAEADLIVALAQIIYTVSEGYFIREATIKIDGQFVEWPREDGTRSSGPVTIFDYPTAAITSQPAYPGIISPATAI
jgi:hypothetical protein